MRLYTICVSGIPVAVISTDTDEPLPDDFVSDSKLMRAYRETRALEAKLKDMTTVSAQGGMDLQEVDEAIDTWLGEDLQALRSNGVPLWDGDRSKISVREARTDEAGRWHAGLREAIDRGEEDAGGESQIVFLVSINGD